MGRANFLLCSFLYYLSSELLIMLSVLVGEVQLCDKVVMLFGCVALILIYTKEDTALITQHRSVFLWV